MDIVPDEPIHFFYWDRETGESLNGDHVVGTPLAAVIAAKLELFCAEASPIENRP